MSLDFHRLEMLLAEASAKPEGPQRVAFLDEACGQDRDLRAEVERLLAASQKAGDFLETPVRAALEQPSPVAAELRGGIEGPGSCIGRYKLLEEIGEGGFGVVFMAEQIEPVQRKVALKIVKAGMDTREVIARFEAERQALALMDHPSIARVFDGGVTQAGRPYFVMELVSGIPITDFCDQRKLSMPERLELFIQVCHAVQHAHQKGIIHRDLKPTNILVTIIDGLPVPKVIDFGVAKALGQKLTEKTFFTGFLKMVGTPAYMSPEQADLSGVDIDTRADIYALGVLLYELLTGVTPFDKESMAKAGLDEVRKMIREAEPPMPSTRISRLHETTRTTIAQQRQAEPGGLSRLVRGDLDWIVMKCLDKDRRRRYESANDLAEDIERYLAQEPVLACPPSTAYRLCKFIRRNKVVLGTAALFGLLLLLSSVISVLQAIRATKAERLAARRLEAETNARMLAEKARTQALAEAAKAIATSELLRKRLDSANILFPNNTQSIVRQLLDDFCAILADQQNQDPAVEASIRATIGNAYRLLGAPEKAQPHLEAALSLRRSALGDRHEKVAQSLLDLGWIYHDRKDDRMAESLARQALQNFQQLNLTPHAIQASTCLQTCLKCLGRFEEAEQVAREALLLAETPGSLQTLGTDKRTETTPTASSAWLELARLCLDIEPQVTTKSDLDTVRNLYQEAATLGGIKDPHDFKYRGWKQRGTTYYSADQWALAITAFSRAIETHRYDGSLYGMRGYCYHQLAQFQKATADYTRLIEMDPQNSANWALRALAYLKLNQPEQAVADYLKAIECWRVRIERLSRVDSVGLKGRPYSWLFASSAELTRAGANPADIRSLYQKLEAAFRDEVTGNKTRYGPTHREVGSALNGLAQFLENEGKFADAAVVWREVILTERSLSGDEDLRVANDLCSLGAVLQRTGKLAEGEAAYREALAIRRKKLGSNHPDIVSCWNSLGMVLKAQGKPTEADAVEPGILSDLTNAVPH